MKRNPARHSEMAPPAYYSRKRQKTNFSLIKEEEVIHSSLQSSPLKDNKRIRSYSNFCKWTVRGRSERERFAAHVQIRLLAFHFHSVGFCEIRMPSVPVISASQKLKDTHFNHTSTTINIKELRKKMQLNSCSQDRLDFWTNTLAKAILKSTAMPLKLPSGGISLWILDRILSYLWHCRKALRGEVCTQACSDHLF